MPERIEADYLIESARVPDDTPATLLGGSGAYDGIPRLEAIVEHTGTDQTRGHGRRLSRVSLSWPLDVIGPSLIGLMNLVAFDMVPRPAFSDAMLVALRLPRPFAIACPGPSFGIQGTRRLSGVAERPLIAAVLSRTPATSPEVSAARARRLCEAGVDLIHDHLMAGDGPRCPFEERVRAVLEVIDSHAQAQGKRVMYAANLSGGVDDMRSRHDLLLDLGGTAMMVNVGSVGLAGVEALRQHSQLPIHVDGAGWGLARRESLAGLAAPAAQLVWRLAGCDHLPAPIAATAAAWPPEDDIPSLPTLKPLFPDVSMLAMPVVGPIANLRELGHMLRMARSSDMILSADGLLDSGIGVDDVLETCEAARQTGGAG